MKITFCFLVALLQTVRASKCPCPDPKPVASDIKYCLYLNSSTCTQINPDDLHKVKFHPCGSLIILTHSYSQNTSDPLLQAQIVETFKKNPKSNIVTVDWSKCNGLPVNDDHILKVLNEIYPQAAKRTCCTGELVGASLVKILSAARVSPKNCHLIGPSVGAHLLGCAAKHVYRRLKEKVGRVTGLDSAGPGFQSMSAECRLSPEDAHQVDCWHTDDGYAGFNGNLGTVDVFVNNGRNQPPCPCDPDSGKMTYSHTLSWKIFTASVNSPLIVYQDTMCPSHTYYDKNSDTNDCDINDGIEVGFNLDVTVSGNIYIETNACPPYARNRKYNCSEEGKDDPSCPV